MGSPRGAQVSSPGHRILNCYFQTASPGPDTWMQCPSVPPPHPRQLQREGEGARVGEGGQRELVNEVAGTGVAFGPAGSAHKSWRVSRKRAVRTVCGLWVPMGRTPWAPWLGAWGWQWEGLSGSPICEAFYLFPQPSYLSPLHPGTTYLCGPSHLLLTLKPLTIMDPYLTLGKVQALPSSQPHIQVTNVRGPSLSAPPTTASLPGPTSGLVPGKEVIQRRRGKMPQLGRR